MRKHTNRLLVLFLTIMLLAGCSAVEGDTALSSYNQERTSNAALPSSEDDDSTDSKESETESSSQETAPTAPQSPYQVLNNNVPEFTEDEITTESFEQYAELDELGRCGTAFACVGVDLMPTEERGSISRVKPTGWDSVKYDCVDGKYLYNRCHLIGFQLTGENANPQNLITGTRYMNVDGMLPFENEVADYVKETEHHVMYRVTPDFQGENLVANGVQIEALSVEDNGEGVSYNVYVYNIQPGIIIDYATGKSSEGTLEPAADATGESYILNTNTMKFHLPSCGSAKQIQAEHREDFEGEREDLLEKGYEPCGKCNP